MILFLVIARLRVQTRGWHPRGLRIFLTHQAERHAGERSRVEWEVLLTNEVETFLDELYESDRVSHQLVN